MNLRKIYEQIRQIHQSQTSELLFVTLHYKQSSFYNILNFDTIKDTLNTILTKLSKLYFKNAFKRYNKRISSYAVAERSKKNRCLHNHIIIQLPIHSNIQEFIKYITKSYLKSEFAHDNLYKKIEVKRVYNAEQLIEYMHKNLQDADAEIDDKNSTYFNIV